MIKAFLIVTAILAASMVLLSIRLLIKKDRFGAEDVGASKAMRERGIHCTTSQDREARRPKRNKINVKEIGILLLICTMIMPGCGIKTQLKRADKKYAIGEYYEAAEAYRKVYGKISPKTDRALKGQVAFRQGECYLILNNPKAANCYQNAIRYKYQDSIVYLHQGKTLQFQGKYKDAEKAYTTYLEAHPDDYVAKAGIYACRQVGEWKKEHSRYKISDAKDFNAKRSSNFAPMFIGNDADALMFTSNRQQSTKATKKKLKRASPVTGAQTFNLFSTRKNAAGKWEDITLPDGLYGESNSEDSGEQGSDSTASKQTGTRELGVCTFTQDGKTMYFTFSCPVNGQDLGAKIYTSSRTGGEWGDAQEVKIFNDSSITCGHPALCPTGDTLYFVSDAPGGKGGKDIWRVEIEGSQIGLPENLGDKVNTSGDEMFPYIHADGTLYFASNGHPGYGGLDLFYVDRDSNTYNMGMPFNSNGDDFGITFAGNSQNGFFSSSRGQKKGIDKIWAFELPEMEFMVEGTVSESNGQVLGDAQIRVVGDDGTNTKVSVKKDGTYRVRLKKDARYVMLAGARGHLNQTGRLTTLDLKDSKTYTQNFVLAPISKPVQMDNIFYDFGQHTLTKESETGLQQLVKLLNDNPNIAIELSAHTDMKGDSVFNVNLSQKRAQSVVDYLTAHGIEKDRLTPVGYGKQKPVVADQNLHKRYSFLPINQELNPEFILTLTEQQQEICNTLNRRTEFKVTKTTYKLY